MLRCEWITNLVTFKPSLNYAKWKIIRKKPQQKKNERNFISGRAELYSHICFSSFVINPVNKTEVKFKFKFKLSRGENFYHRSNVSYNSGEFFECVVKAQKFFLNCWCIYKNLLYFFFLCFAFLPTVFNSWPFCVKNHNELKVPTSSFAIQMNRSTKRCYCLEIIVRISQIWVEIQPN